MPEIIMGDYFYVDLPSQQVEWIYYNPDSTSGGQYVINYFDRQVFETALKQFEASEEIFDYIGSASEQYLADKGSMYFQVIRDRLNTEKPDAIGCGYFTLDQMSLLFIARDLIDEYCRAEFNSPAIFRDLRKIGIGYITTEDSKHDIQVYANLRDFRLETYLNDKIAAYRCFDSLRDMVDNGLCDLDFDDLVNIPDWVVKSFEETESRGSMASRIATVLRDIYPEHFEMLVEESGNIDDVVAAMRMGLKQPDTIEAMVSELSNLYWEFKPTGSNDVVARELMTDLHHMFTEVACVPVYDREPQILDETFSALGFSGYEINFDREGICISNAGQSWHNEEFYRHFVSKLTPEMQKHLMKTDFGIYTDFKDLAAHYDVDLPFPENHRKGRSDAR